MQHKTCAVMQPTYFPWLGYFALIEQVNKFVFLDDVQMEKNSWQIRNKIKTAQGELFLSISRKRNRGDTLLLIKDTELNDLPRWREKHIKTIEINYYKSRFFEEVFPFIRKLILYETNKLSDYDINIIKSICHKLNINTEFILSSDLKSGGKKDFKVAHICKLINCNKYLSPVGASCYINKENKGGEFIKQNINLFYQNFVHPEYSQLYGDFISHLSILDLLFNEGFINSINIIKKGIKQPIFYEELDGKEK